MFLPEGVRQTQSTILSLAGSLTRIVSAERQESRGAGNVLGSVGSRHLQFLRIFLIRFLRKRPIPDFATHDQVPGEDHRPENHHGVEQSDWMKRQPRPIRPQSHLMRIDGDPEADRYDGQGDDDIQTRSELQQSSEEGN